MNRRLAQPASRARAQERGFTLIEVLLAIAILTIGVIGVGATLAVTTSGIGSSITFGQVAVTRGHYISAATMLAQERMEQVKRLTWDSTTNQFNANPPTGFADEGYDTITNYGNFRRQVRVTANTPDTNMNTITVTVFFRPPRESGVANEESVTIGTIIARRP